MSTQIQTDHFTTALYALLDETFDNVHGYFLDRGTSMFETLATISAGVCSSPAFNSAHNQRQINLCFLDLDHKNKVTRPGFRINRQQPHG